MSAGKQKRDGAQSIRRAIALLRILATAKDAGMGLSEIARQAGLSNPTAHRMLHVLVGEGIVEQRPRTRRYALGGEIPLLALARSAASPALNAALPILGVAVEKFGDTGFLTLRSGLDTVCLARRVGSYPIQVLALNVGDRRPLGVSSAGFAILAAMPAAEARSILARNTARLASYGITAEEALAIVQQTRARGFALRERGLVPGTRALSVTFRLEPTGGAPLLAALTVAAIARRLQAPRVLQVVEHLQEALAGPLDAPAKPDMS